MGRLTGKNALITGGTAGIGLASAVEFTKEGARVAICGRNSERLTAALQVIGGNGLGYQADAGVLSDLDELYAQAGRDLGHIDILFANAGWSEFAPFEKVTEQSFDAQLAGNLKATFFTIQKALPLLREGSSVIINASVAANKGWPNTSVVAAIKASQRNLARTISAELISRKIRVNAISPGPIDNEFFGRSDAETALAKKAFHLKVNPSRRLGTSEEIAKLAVYLASDDSAWVIGADFAIDGGAGSLP